MGNDPLISLLMNKKSSALSIAIVGLMFFIFGFVSWVNAILIPYFKISLELTNFQSYLVAFAFYIAYFVMSMPASLLLEKVGFKKGMMFGFWIMALGAALFVPAALTRTYGLFLLGLFSIGTGLAILQTAANPYITIVGPIDRAAQRMSIMGICNKLAGILAPLVFAAVVLKVTDSDLFNALKDGTMSAFDKEIALTSLIRRVILPYSILSGLLLLVGLLVYKSPLPEINTSQANQEETDADHGGRTSILQFPWLILGAFAIFFHVGSQIIAIDTIIGYAQSMGLNLLEAKTFPSYTLGATMTGYLIGIICIPRFISQRNALITVTTLGVILSLAVLLTHGDVVIFGHHTDISIWFLVALGLPNSLIYANIWPLAIKGLGRFTKLGSSLLVMGLCGNALTPLIYGRLADVWNVHNAYVILLPCYLYLVFYAIYGHKITHWRRVKTA
ncbi:MAG: sugar MFS transporter [Bacteroidales bacterium]|nr:sugar MFS transporter [Bacteroidales bacterium]